MKVPAVSSPLSVVSSTVCEKPMLFSAPMVRAILRNAERGGRNAEQGQPKTQTRRVVKTEVSSQWSVVSSKPDLGSPPSDITHACPYGQPGERIWVREEHYRFGNWVKVAGVRTKGGRQKWKFVATMPDVLFEPPATFRKGRHSKDPETQCWHKRLARFMPRKLARITLEIVGVRVERLQEISEADAVAEGIEAVEHEGEVLWNNYLYHESTETYRAFRDPRRSYRSLWESINGVGSWELNPWVWVVEFKRINVS